jgi:hypothetical protein
MADIWSIKEEAARLKQRFAEAKRSGIGQAQFARNFKVPGGASMVNQNCSGNRPISLEAATAYAKGFRCTLAEISPRLAAGIAPHTVTVPVKTGQLSPGALDLAALFDMIPADQVLLRAEAQAVCANAIISLLRGQRGAP